MAVARTRHMVSNFKVVYRNKIRYCELNIVGRGDKIVRKLMSKNIMTEFKQSELFGS